MKSLLEKLANTASKLDTLQETKLANGLDKVIVSLANEYQDPSYTELSLELEEELLQEDKQKELLEQTNKEEELNILTKNFFTDSKDKEKYLEQYLLNVGIVPLKVRGSAHLGSGFEGDVFRGLWNGKQVAVKITDSQDEILNAQDLMEIRDSLSDNAKRHTPEIYKIDGDGSGYNYIVMELLQQPPEFMLRQLFDFEDGKVTSPIMQIGSLLKDEGKIYTALIDAAEQASVPKYFANEVFKNFLNLKLPEVIKNPQEWKQAISYINNKIFEYVNKVEKELNKTFKGSVSFAEAFVANLIFMVKPTFPEYPQFLETDESVIKEIPELHSFFQALKELGQEGLWWGDLNYGNIMQRPSTGDFVFIDLSHFTTEVQYDWGFE